MTIKYKETWVSCNGQLPDPLQTAEEPTTHTSCLMIRWYSCKNQASVKYCLFAIQVIFYARSVTRIDHTCTYGNEVELLLTANLFVMHVIARVIDFKAFFTAYFVTVQGIFYRLFHLRVEVCHANICQKQA